MSASSCSCGSMLESKAGAGSKSINELLEASIPAGTEVVIQTGGASSWSKASLPVFGLKRK